MACTAPAGVPPRADRDPWLEDGPPPAADSAPAEALSAAAEKLAGPPGPVCHLRLPLTAGCHYRDFPMARSGRLRAGSMRAMSSLGVDSSGSNSRQGCG
jgi:hypothetical protein